MGNQPEQRFKAGAVTASVWLNKGEKGDYRTVSLQRVYKDAKDEWVNTDSLRVNDLPKAMIVLQEAYTFMVRAVEKRKE